MIDTTKGFTLTREFLATPAAVWAAWTDADQAAQWLHPRGVSTPRESVTIDAREDGEYAYTMVNDATGEQYPTGGRYFEVEPEHKLVFTWGNPGDATKDTPIVTVEMEAVGDLTRLTFTIRGVEGMVGDGSFYDGWQSALDSLSSHLQGFEPVG